MPTEEAVIIETLFRIPNKDGEEVPFRLNSVQRRLDDALTGRDIVPKARQPGISSYFLARYTAKCLIKRNVNAVIISHESEATQRLLARCRYFLSHMEGGRKIQIGRDSQNAITFPETNSSLWIGTAGARAFGRGDTIHALHCSEYAYWPNAKDLMNGLNEAVPINGEIAIESTGNGIGNDYYRRCIRARDGASHYKLHFFGYDDIPEYRFDLSEEEEEIVKNTLRDDLEEVKLYESGILDLGQIAWRRIKLEDRDYDLITFKQEYPLTFEDCFQATGKSIFYRVKYEPTQDWTLQDKNLHILEGHPKPNRAYCMGVDPSGGVGNDNAAIEIFDPIEKCQVAEYTDNAIPPDLLAHRAADLARLFNHAFMTVESNNHGIVTIHELRTGGPDNGELYPGEFVYEQGIGGGLPTDENPLAKAGLRTTQRSKPLMIGRLRTAVAKEYTIYSSALKGEMDTYIEKDGKLGAEEGCLDDRVMACACALWGEEYAQLMFTDGMDFSDVKENAYKDPFSFEEIEKSLRATALGGREW